MAQLEKPYSRFIGGIADFDKESLTPNAMYFERQIDFRSNPRQATILPRTIKKSASMVVDLIKWFEAVGTTVYAYGDNGHFYKYESGAVSDLNQSPNSHGNGLVYYPDDDSIYYANDTSIGRYGKLSGTPTFINDYFTTIGGVPQNTQALSLVAASSQYAYRADTATLSQTGDITLEANLKPTSFPTVGNQMVIASKWDESGTTRSYRFGIRAVGGYFGDGSDGSLTISTNYTDVPIDATCTGTAGSYSLAATNVNFAAGQILLIHQTQGTGAGNWMRNKVIGYVTGTITLDQPLNASYVAGAQVIVLKRYTNVTVNNGVTWTAKAWDGSKGGILACLCNGTFTNNGTVSAAGGNGTYSIGNGTTAITTGGGFRGGLGHAQEGGTVNCGRGENYANSTGLSGAGTNTAYGNGGGGAYFSGGNTFKGGGGGGHFSGGQDGYAGGGGGGGTAGTADLTTMVFGGGGGGGGSTHTNKEKSSGGAGGGIIFISASQIVNTGLINANGGNSGYYGVVGNGAFGGAGAGGSILLKCQTASLGTGTVTADKGKPAMTELQGGTASYGRIHMDYYTSYTGTTTPDVNTIVDGNLANNNVNQLYLDVSANGTTYDELVKQADALSSGSWQHVAVTWKASTSTATFYLDGVSIGTSTGSLTAIHDNASQFIIGASKNVSGTVTNFYNGLIDDVRLWSTVRTQADLIANKDTQLIGSQQYLQAYYKFNNSLADATTNSNDLTGSGSPTYSTDVPFPSPNGRYDVDLAQDLSGQTYTLPSGITETATNTVTFTPTKDPQKSIDIKLATKGTGNWTLTIHDASHKIIAQKTILNAALPGSAQYVEFIFDTVWRPILSGGGAQYHFHLTSSDGSGTVTTGTGSDLSTVAYHTYFQYLVSDTNYHSMKTFLNFIGICNGRYLGIWDLIEYNPNRLIFPGEYSARCLGLFNEYFAIGCVKGSDVTSNENGRIFFWDGVSDLYNFFIDVPEGAINAMLGTKGVLEFIAGYNGAHMRYQGGASAEKIRRLPKVANSDKIEIMPGAMTMYKALLHYGTGPSTSSTIERGVYSYGSLNRSYPEALGYDYKISTDSTGAGVTVGALTANNGNLLIGWKDGLAYGLDEVSPTNNPYPSASIEFLTEDADRVYKDKTLQLYKGQYVALHDGESVIIKYSTDRGMVTTMTDTTEDSREVRLTINNGRCFEYQAGVELQTTTTTAPILLAAIMQYEDNASEQLI